MRMILLLWMFLSSTIALAGSARDLAIDLTGKPNLMAGVTTWEEHAIAQDLKPAIYYRYLVGYGSDGWRGWNSPDGDYSRKVMDEAKMFGSVPMFTYYQIALELEWGNNEIEQSKLMQYLADLKLMFQYMGKFGKPAMVQLEPDFFGYLQQRYPDPSKLKANIQGFADCQSFPNTAPGLMRCIVNMGHKTAPKVKIGYHASQWGDWYDETDKNADVEKHARSVADFLLSMGAAETDFVTMEVLDRDAGYYEATSDRKEYWDESNRTLPNFHAFFRWAKAVHDRIKLPILYWQLPLGVPSNTPGGTPKHYRDNRVKYFFNHPEEVAATGAFGMVFGRGEDTQTTVDTDGFQFRDALKKYNSNPFVLTGDSTPPPEPKPPETGELDLGVDGKLQLHTLGDSITEDPGWRTALYKGLVDMRIPVDFTGTKVDGYPRTPEPEHDGHAGYTTANVLKELDGWLGDIKKSELTIVMLGTNDVAWWTLDPETLMASRLGEVVDKVQANSPKGLVIVTSIPPQGGSDLPKTVPPDDRIRKDMVDNYNAEVKKVLATKSNVYFVDIFSILSLSDLVDGIHPGDGGNIKIANAFLDKIREITSGTAPKPRPEPDPEPKPEPDPEPKPKPKPDKKDKCCCKCSKKKFEKFGKCCCKKCKPCK